MPEHSFVYSLALVFSVAAVTTLLSRRARLPLVFGYMLAGFFIGPNVLAPPMADAANIRALAELGIIFLMFSVGLEFSLAKLSSLISVAGPITLLQCSVMFLLGLAVSRALGWSTIEGIFAGSMIAISSTAIVVQVLSENHLMKSALADLVIGILICEDVVAILLLVILTSLVQHEQIGALTVLKTGAGVLLYVLATVALGIALLPRLVRWIRPEENRELATVFLIGTCFFSALVAKALGYSAALGSFLAGAVLAGTGAYHSHVRSMEPLKNMFAALFFVSVGMLLNPADIFAHWPALLGLVGVILVGKALTVAVGGVLAGVDSITALQAGLSLGQIGEFSFVIAALGAASGSVRPALFSIAVATAAITTLFTPTLVQTSRPIAERINQRLPPRLQTFASLYVAWIAKLRAGRMGDTNRSHLRLLALRLALDVLAGSVLGLCVLVLSGDLVRIATKLFSVSPQLAKGIVALGGVLVLLPFVYGVVRLAHSIGLMLAQRLWPPGVRGVDLQVAPRNTFMGMVQLFAVLLAGCFMLAILSPWLPVQIVGVLLSIFVVSVLWRTWRATGNLHGHVRATTQVLSEALLKRSLRGNAAALPAHDAVIDELLAGFGGARLVAIGRDFFAVGKSLAQLGIGARTCATVISIRRGDRVMAAGGHVALAWGDELVLAGAPAALDRAAGILARGES